jgi:hypothetical protein
MNLHLASYADQARQWPQSGQHILAQFDDETIIVYQAYRSSIGRFAVENGFFGGDFSYSRMSWTKPNFLWMMYRSDWGRSEGQEVVLAIRLRRSFFDSILEKAVASSFGQSGLASQSEWQAAVVRSDVRLQWDPDHLPNGQPCARRAVQLGIRGKTLEAYGKEQIVEIIDMSDFVSEQCERVNDLTAGGLVTPLEQVYRPSSAEAARTVGLDGD